jgi:DNA repair exonuclease SbcCD ATPase subunit
MKISFLILITGCLLRAGLEQTKAQAQYSEENAAECRAEIRDLNENLMKLRPNLAELNQTIINQQGQLQQATLELNTFKQQAMTAKLSIQQQINHYVDAGQREYNLGLACKPFSEVRKAHIDQSQRYYDEIPELRQRLNKVLDSEKEGRERGAKNVAGVSAALQNNETSAKQVQDAITKDTTQIAYLQGKIKNFQRLSPDYVAKP